MVRVRFIHPIIKFDKRLADGNLVTLLESVLEETKKYNVYSKKKKEWLNRLRGCIVLRNGVQVGYFAAQDFITLLGLDDEVMANDEIVIMLPLSGG